MQSKNKNKDSHIDSSRFGKKSRASINAEAAQEKRALKLTGRYKRFRAHVDGNVYEIPIPDVRAIREGLHMSQAEFARHFHLSQRTVQQWEQRRALPDMPARVLLRAIQQAPEVIAKAAAEVHKEIQRTGSRTV